MQSDDFPNAAASVYAVFGRGSGRGVVTSLLVLLLSFRACGQGCCDLSGGYCDFRTPQHVFKYDVNVCYGFLFWDLFGTCFVLFCDRFGMVWVWFWVKPALATLLLLRTLLCSL